MGMINILDKVVIVRYFRSPLTLPFLIGIAQGAVGIVLIAALRWHAVIGTLMPISLPV